MIRITSSETLPIFVKASISASLSFGLLSTAADTSLFESRTSTERCSRVPLIASFIRSSTDSEDSILCSGSAGPGSSGSSVSVSRSGSFKSIGAAAADASAGSASSSGTIGAAPVVAGAGSMPRPLKKVTISDGVSCRPRNVRSGPTGRASSVSEVACGSPGSGSSESSTSSAICSCARGASAPCAASRRTSRATSPRRKKSISGERNPGSISA